MQSDPRVSSTLKLTQLAFSGSQLCHEFILNFRMTIIIVRKNCGFFVTSSCCLSLLSFSFIYITNWNYLCLKNSLNDFYSTHVSLFLFNFLFPLLWSLYLSTSLCLRIMYTHIWLWCLNEVPSDYNRAIIHAVFNSDDYKSRVIIIELKIEKLGKLKLLFLWNIIFQIKKGNYYFSTIIVKLLVTGFS